MERLLGRETMDDENRDDAAYDRAAGNDDQENKNVGAVLQDASINNVRWNIRINFKIKAR